MSTLCQLWHLCVCVFINRYRQDINLGLTDNDDEEKFLADVKEFMHNDLIVIEKETLHKSILGNNRLSLYSSKFLFQNHQQQQRQLKQTIIYFNKQLI